MWKLNMFVAAVAVMRAARVARPVVALLRELEATHTAANLQEIQRLHKNL